jgi:hypothetical protein
MFVIFTELEVNLTRGKRNLMWYVAIVGKWYAVFDVRFFARNKSFRFHADISKGKRECPDAEERTRAPYTSSARITRFEELDPVRYTSLVFVVG